MAVKVIGHVVALVAIGTLLGPASAYADATPRGKTTRGTALVDYRRSGGLAGREDHLVVRRSGRAVLTTRLKERQHFRVRRSIRGRLRSALRRAGFSTLDPVYRNPNPVADDFRFTITYRGRTVRADGTALPTKLGRVVAVLSGIIDRSSPGPAIEGRSRRDRARARYLGRYFRRNFAGSLWYAAITKMRVSKGVITIVTKLHLDRDPQAATAICGGIEGSDLADFTPGHTITGVGGSRVPCPARERP